jgi:hypothetical protein
MLEDLMINACALLGFQRSLNGLLMSLKKGVVDHLRCIFLHGYADHAWLRLLGRGGEDLLIPRLADEP